MNTNEKTKHIIFFSALYAPHTGGVETYTQNLVEVLGARGVRVSVVCMNTEHAPAYEEVHGARIYRLPCRSFMGGRFQMPKRNGTYRMIMHQIIDDLRIDEDTYVVVNTRFYPHSLDGARFASEHHLPLLVIEHGSAHLTIGNPTIDRIIARYEHAMTRRLLGFRPLFAGVSATTTAWLTHFGISTHQVIANAIDVDEFHKVRSPRDFRSELNLGDAYLVAFVGRFSPEKGIKELIEAARLAPDVTVVCAGAGSLEAYTDDLPKNLISVGLLDRADISALYATADAFCLPSRSEGFCTALLEAASWGVTPIITQVGGVDEVTSAGRFGMILPDARPETIAHALTTQAQRAQEHSDECASDSEALIAHVAEHCSWGVSAERLLEILERA